MIMNAQNRTALSQDCLRLSSEQVAAVTDHFKRRRLRPRSWAVLGLALGGLGISAGQDVLVGGGLRPERGQSLET